MQRRGVTLIELMVALSITLIMMGAVVTLFGNMTTSVTDSRAVIEISERLRAARNRLQLDLTGHTATTMPPRNPEAGEGYLEIIEGLAVDHCSPLNAAAASLTLIAPVQYKDTLPNSIMGDCDDVLALTVRTRGEPFVGHALDVNGNPIMAQSQEAEIIWFALPNGTQIPTSVAANPIQLYTLYRRVLLVLPQANVSSSAVVNGTPVGTVPNFNANVDVSTRFDVVAGQNVANSLGDLTKRENRYLHGTPSGNVPSGLPFELLPANLVASVFGTLPNSSSRFGEDVILTDVLAFDIKVFDPGAVVRTSGGVAITPSDPGYLVATPTTTLGCYVNLWYPHIETLGAAGTAFSGFSATIRTPFTQPTYDTWSMHYEQNGYDDDGVAGVDQGTNGLDDPITSIQSGIVDDAPTVYLGSQSGLIYYGEYYDQGERETIPPYPVPLRGVQISIRVYEPSTRQVRQVTVVQDFLPE